MPRCSVRMILFLGVDTHTFDSLAAPVETNPCAAILFQAEKAAPLDSRCECTRLECDADVTRQIIKYGTIYVLALISFVALIALREYCRACRRILLTTLNQLWRCSRWSTSTARSAIICKCTSSSSGRYFRLHILACIFLDARWTLARH